MGSFRKTASRRTVIAGRRARRLHICDFATVSVGRAEGSSTDALRRPSQVCFSAHSTNRAALQSPEALARAAWIGRTRTTAASSPVSGPPGRRNIGGTTNACRPDHARPARMRRAGRSAPGARWILFVGDRIPTRAGRYDWQRARSLRQGRARQLLTSLVNGVSMFEVAHVVSANANVARIIPRVVMTVAATAALPVEVTIGLRLPEIERPRNRDCVFKAPYAPAR